MQKRRVFALDCGAGYPAAAESLIRTSTTKWGHAGAFRSDKEPPFPPPQSLPTPPRPTVGDSDPPSTCLLTAAPCKPRGQVPLRAPSPGRQEAMGWLEQTVCRGATQGSSSPACLVGQAWAAGSPETSERVHAAFLLPSFAQGPASSSPLCGRPAPSPAPPGCHALPLCTGSLLGTASHPALLTVPHSPRPTAG